jgi:O-antigen ligase
MCKIVKFPAMIRRIMVAALQLGVLAFSLATLLFAGEDWRTSSGFIGSAIRELEAIFRDSTTQWMVLVCLAFYFVAFLVFEFRSCPDGKWWRLGNPILWQCAFVGLALVVYTVGYSKSSNSTATLIVLGTIVFGKAISMWMDWKRGNSERRRLWLICLLIVLLAASVFWQRETNRVFQYNGLTRWTGVWDNPNVFGLLMGLSLVLSFGMAIGIWHAASNRLWRIIGIFFSPVAALIVGFGLFKSFSRGAWLGTAIGVACLLWLKFQSGKWYPFGRSALWNWKTGSQVTIIVFALAALGFWQLRFIKWQPARRVFSSANANDFSWRNRIAAWKGAIRMMEHRPFFGYGWGKAETVYSEKYRPAQIESGAAIQMNDYFMLGISAGVPALVCFLVYVGLSLRSPRSTFHSPQLTKGLCLEGRGSMEQVEVDWLRATSRAGAIVLLVGFFFDGGLFKLATGSMFWILLELGRVDVYRGKVPGKEGNNMERLVRSLAPPDAGVSEISAAPGRFARCEVWLRRCAWVLGVAAVSESVILLTTPFFGVNRTTLAISRHYLVPPAAVADLNLLATNVDWSSRKLRPLLQHASLANYNRQLINWKLDDQVYRDYVLNPLVDSQRDGQLAWRRKLWEYFYLPMRKKNDPSSAAQIVLKFLHQRIAVVPEGPATIDEMWREKRADERGIQALGVAAFRSVGIPARLNESGRAELFSDGKWQPLPEYTPSASQSAQGR